jgi:Cu-Zn family superoxide dismutase
MRKTALKDNIDPAGLRTILVSMMKKTLLTGLLGLGLVFGAFAYAQDIPQQDRRQALLVDSFGKTSGTATFQKTAKGILIRVEATGLTQGWHGVHLHGVGDCSDHMDHFVIAGGHAANAGQAHGYFNVTGPHSGDLPNIWAGLDGNAAAEFYTEGLIFDALHDEDGAALMIHATPDDYNSQPAGESGERVACGVVVQ